MNTISVHKITKYFLNIIFFICIINANLFAKDVLNILQTSTEKIILSSQDNTKIKINQSGFIISSYQNLEFINAIVQVVSIDKDKITTKIIEKNPFAKEHLAHLNLPISTKDKAVFNLYKKSFIIASNKKSYDYMLNNYNKDFLSPEIALKHSSSIDVSKKDLFNLAKKYLLDKIYLVINNKLFIIDAFSQRVLEQKELDINAKNTHRPFYSQIQSKGLTSIYKMMIKFTYDSYYTNLFKVKNK